MNFETRFYFSRFAFALLSGEENDVAREYHVDTQRRGQSTIDEGKRFIFVRTPKQPIRTRYFETIWIYF